jgi:hypothetical protein
MCGGALASTLARAQPADSPYKFERGYPAAGTAERGYDAADLRRAIEAYKFFYSTIATEALMQQVPASDKPNQVGVKMATAPRHQVPTGNSDTPYGFGPLDLEADGPMVVELPPGTFISFVNDHNCRWVMDIGTIGPDKGQGGKHLVLPPDYKGDVPESYYVGRSKTWKAFLANPLPQRPGRRRQGAPGARHRQGLPARQGGPAGHLPLY